MRAASVAPFGPEWWNYEHSIRATILSCDNRISLYLKYSTKGRSPWGFTFTMDEQVLLQRKRSESKIVIGLICGADGVAA